MDPKKASKKTKKFSQKLHLESGIICTSTPTKNIVLCNVGQATGLDKEHLLKCIQTLCPDIELPRYTAEKGQSHSFLVFNLMDDAQEFLHKAHGKMKISDDGPHLYMVFCDKVPDYKKMYSNTNPSGLTVIENFISRDEEKFLYELFDWEEIDTKGFLKNRQVRHYGYDFRYGSNDVDLGLPLENKIPKECNFLFERLTKSNVRISKMPDQLTVNKYVPGQGIPSHVDKHSPFGECILSLSLGGSVVMDWKHHSGNYVPVLVPKRSMLAMQGEARYDWQHGIQARTWDPNLTIEEKITETGTENVKIVTDDQVLRDVRISLTFRWTRSGPCLCTYPTLCDSQTERNTLTEESVAEKLENLHVHNVYEKIASHFSSTRHKRWPRVEQFVRRQAAGSVMLDLGSGNGKNILNRNDTLQIAAERSAGLLAECKSHVAGVAAADCVRADLLSTPLVDRCADSVICIAVIHHFCNQSRRIKAISEISRLLRPGGEALITVWARDQTKANYLCKNKESVDKKPQTHSVEGVNLPVHENRTQFEHNDLLVPWKLRNQRENNVEQEVETLLRYYHVFEENELDKLCESVAGLTVVETFYEQGNWCVICKKC